MLQLYELQLKRLSGEVELLNAETYKKKQLRYYDLSCLATVRAVALLSHKTQLAFV